MLKRNTFTSLALIILTQAILKGNLNKIIINFIKLSTKYIQEYLKQEMILMKRKFLKKKTLIDNVKIE